MSAGPPAVLSSVHTHSRYCDGRAEIEDYVRSAIDRGLAAVGASGHSPMPFERDCAMPLDSLDAYRADVRRLQRRYADRIPVLLGLEIDYVPELVAFYERHFLRAGFDYFVASVHFVGGGLGNGLWNYDESEELFASEVARRFRGQAWPVVHDYYRRVQRMVEDLRGWPVPIIVGHLDRIAIWNKADRYFATDGEDYLALVDEVLATIAGAGFTVELNTSYWVKGPEAPNPALALLPRCVRHGIPVIVSADAHDPADIDLRYEAAAAALVEAGYDRVVVPGPEAWASGRIEVPARERRSAPD